MNSKIAITVLAALIISFSAVYLLDDWYRSNFDLAKWEEIFYSQEFDPNKKKLYILGSSFVVRINQTFIEEYLISNEKDYDVYNLGIPVDFPKKRVESLDLILESKPDTIVYGIGFRDLMGEGSEVFDERILKFTVPAADDDKSNLLQSQFDFDEIFSNRKILGIDFENFKNPKFVSLKTLDFIIEGKDPTPPVKSLPKHPFQGQGPQPLLTTEQIEEKYAKLRYIDRLDLYGKNAISLEQILSEFSKNEITVFILLTPYHEFYLNQVPEEEWNKFYSKIENLSEKYDVKIIDLHDKYSDLKIWNDWRHIGYHTNSSVYYEDISLAILEGL